MDLQPSFRVHSYSDHPLFVVALALVPVLTVAASYYGTRGPLLTMFLLLGLFAFWGLRKTATDNFYVFLLSSIGLSLVLGSAFVSQNLSGIDVHQEYYIFSQTVADGWHPGNPIQYNSLLSISVLPAILYTVTGLGGISLFKIVFPIIYCLVPLVLYRVYRKFLPSQFAFLSAFLFLAFPSSYIEIISLGRQEIAELILAVLLWVMCTPSLRKSLAGKVTSGILTVGLVTSHYSLAFIYLLILAFSLALAKVSRRTPALCTTSMFAFSTLIVLSWYLFVAGGTILANVTDLVATVAAGVLGDLLNPFSRPSVVVAAFSLTGASGLLHIVNRVTQYAVQFFLLTGFIAFAVVVPKNDSAKTILYAMIVPFVLLFLSVVVPFFAFALELNRIYHIALLFIAPCFVYGVDWLASWFGRRSISTHFPWPAVRIPRRRIFAAAILATYFLFVGGWVWAVSSDSPTSFLLDSKRMADSPNIDVRTAYFGEYTVAEDISASQWLKHHASNTHMVCADFVSSDNALNSYGGFSRYLPQIPDECGYENEYVFLSLFNAVYSTGTGEDPVTSAIVTWPMSEISPELAPMNVVYSGGAIVYLSN